MKKMKTKSKNPYLNEVMKGTTSDDEGADAVNVDDLQLKYKHK